MIKDADIDINGYLTNIIGYTIILVSKMCFLPSHPLYSLKGCHTHNLKIAVVRRVPSGKQGCGGNFDKTRYFTFVKQKSSIKIMVEPYYLDTTSIYKL